MTFRFQQLLGDFKEGDFPTLSTDEREGLVRRCIAEVRTIHELEGKPLLVTADSPTFLAQVDELPFVTIVKGRLVHIAYSDDRATETHLKSFLDLWLISGAETVYSVCYGKMYNSGFPRLGARIGNRPFVQIRD